MDGVVSCLLNMFALLFYISRNCATENMHTGSVKLSILHCKLLLRRMYIINWYPGLCLIVAVYCLDRKWNNVLPQCIHNNDINQLLYIVTDLKTSPLRSYFTLISILIIELRHTVVIYWEVSHSQIGQLSRTLLINLNNLFIIVFAA